MVFQPRHRDGKTPEQKQQQRKDGEQRQRRHRAVGDDDAGRLGNPLPKHPGTDRFEQEQQHAETGNEKLFELFARTLRRENLRVLRFKQRGAALAFDEFVQLQFFQPLVFLQPHLEPADKGHEGAEAEENGCRLPGHGMDIAHHDKGGDENHRGRDQVH